MTDWQWTRAPLTWPPDEQAEPQHGPPCGGAIVNSRSEPWSAVDRAVCARCGQEWARKNAAHSWVLVLDARE